MIRKDTFSSIFGADRKDVISLKVLGSRIWKSRRFIIKWELIGIIVGLIICFSIPKEYISVIKIVPEKRNSYLVNLSYKNLIDQFLIKDAFSYRLYPNVINSQSFLYDLLDVSVPITTDAGTEMHTVRNLLDEEYKRPWWEWIFNLSEQTVDYLSNSDSNKGTAYKPTEKDLLLIGRLKNNITLVIMDRTDHLELEVKMQDPLASAVLADTIAARLTKIITDYRNNKMVRNQDFVDKKFKESKLRYEESCQKYADYLDSNNSIVKNIDKLIMQRLNIERMICFNDYQMNADDYTSEIINSSLYSPLFYILEPSRVATKSSYPRKLVILSYCMFYFGYIPFMISILKKV